MAPSSIIAELDSIITYADNLKAKAKSLRAKLEPVIVVKKRPVSNEAVAEVLNKRRKSLLK